MLTREICPFKPSYGLSDYEAMFSLGEAEYKMRILDCQAGLGAFSAELNEKGVFVVSQDPLYSASVEQMHDIVQAAEHALNENIKGLAQFFNADSNVSQNILENHLKNAKRFLSDFEKHRDTERYVNHTIEKLPFDTESFDLALISDCLFANPSAFDGQKVIAILSQLLKIANEVRVFPLVTNEGALSPLIGEVIAQLQLLNFDTELATVRYPYHQQADGMLRVWTQSCSISAHKNHQISS